MLKHTSHTIVRMYHFCFNLLYPGFSNAHHGGFKKPPLSATLAMYKLQLINLKTCQYTLNISKAWLQVGEFQFVKKKFCYRRKLQHFLTRAL